MTESTEQPTVPVVTPLARTLPVSVTVIAILFFLSMLSEVNFIRTYANMSAWNFFDLLDLLASAIFASAFLLMSIGLLARWPWARIGAIIVLIARFIVIVPLKYLLVSKLIEASFIVPRLISADALIIAAIAKLLAIAWLYGIIIFFLTRPGVKAAFTSKRDSQPA